jgi:hypothetical protein
MIYGDGVRVGSYIAASAKACCVATVWEHGARRRKGVERPAAVRGWFGRARKQLVTLAWRAAAVFATATTIGEVVAAAVEVFADIVSVVLLTILA